MSEEKLSKKEYEEYIFLKQLRNNELAKIVRNKVYKQKLTPDNMIVLQEKQLNKQKEILDKIKEYIKENANANVDYILELFGGNRMKVIDLLNKIANKEKLPNKIRIRGIYYRDYDEETDEMIDKEDMIIWELDNSYAYGDYYSEDGKELFSNCYIVNRILNEEVEILDYLEVNNG